MTRRDVLHQCLATGALVVAPSLTESKLFAFWQEAEARHLRPTPPNDLGPYFKPDAPRLANLIRPGDAGLPLKVHGAVFNTRGSALGGARIEVWHADPGGQYDNQGFHYRAQLNAEREGKYSFVTHLPGHYPGRVCQHIHYKVTAEGCKPLITQLYFGTDPVFEGDPDKNYAKDPILISRELIRPVSVYPVPNSLRAEVAFEIVLEPLG